MFSKIFKNNFSPFSCSLVFLALHPFLSSSSMAFTLISSDLRTKNKRFGSKN
ncbi:hypothetical protein CsatA_012099 [Cannabis sativa]